MVATLRVINALRRNIIILKLHENEQPRYVPPGSIDVWWRGRENGELMLLLAHLLKQNPEWRNRSIRLMRVVSDEAAREDVLKHLEQLAKDSRIEVKANVFVSSDPSRVISEQSQNSAIAIFGFQLPEMGQEATFFRNLQTFSENIPRALFVSSIGNMTLS